MPLEQIRSIPVSANVRRESIIFGFTWAAVLEPLILTEQDALITQGDANFVNTETHWENGTKISFQDRQNIAATQTLLALPTLLAPNQSLAIPRAVHGAEGVYSHTEQQLAHLGFPIDHKYNRTISEITRLAIRNPGLTDDTYAGVAQSVWDARGTVEIDVISIAELGEAEERGISANTAPDYFYEAHNGGLLEEFVTPDLPTHKVRVPYYHQLTTRNAYSMLTAYLDDITAIDSQLRALDS